MAGFRKAKAEQAAIKMGIYGPPGSGKTFTALLIAEGLARYSGKRIAYVDTERGTDFYCKAVPDRPVHPEAFDFDALYTRSITEVLSALKSMSEDEYGVIVIDSMTHIWESAKSAYTGRLTSIGSIPMQAWQKLKKPYKEVVSILLSTRMHVLILGREGTEYATDEETEELKAIGKKMKAEGETPYEPHILIRMEALKPRKTNELAQIVAYIEKDRTGVLSGRSFINPNFDSLCKPILSLLGDTQAKIASEDETAAVDGERIAEEERNREKQSAELLRQWSAKIALAETAEDLKGIGKQITPQLKAKMLPQHVAELRDQYQQREEQVKRAPPQESAASPLAQINAIIERALSTADSETAYITLDEASMLAEKMNGQTREDSLVAIECAMAEIAARVKA